MVAIVPKNKTPNPIRLGMGGSRVEFVVSDESSEVWFDI